MNRKHKTHRPSVARLLEQLAFHCREMHNTPPGRVHRSGIGFEDLTVLVEVEVTRAHWNEDASGCDVWDQCKVNGRHEGNRCGGEKAIAALYAPVIAAAAAYWASAPADPDTCAICHGPSDAWATFDSDGAGLCYDCHARDEAAA